MKEKSDINKSILPNDGAIKRLREKITELKADCAVVFKKSNIFYLTGHNTPGILILNKDECLLFFSSTEREILKNGKKDNINYREFKFSVPWDEIIKELKGLKVAVNISATITRKIDLLKKNSSAIVDLKDFVEDMRSVKTEAEISFIKKAADKTADILNSIDISNWCGKSEAELAGYLSQRFWEDGMSGQSFMPIVSTFKNSVYPHHVPGKDKIEGLVMIDAGNRYKGYCSDLTRTFILDKFIKDFNLTENYRILEKAKQNAVSYLKPGALCSEVFEAAVKVLKDNGKADYFTHGLGHGVGIDIHEKPYLRPGSKETLKEGMVVTVEPGIYIKDIFGMRLEDIYLITKEGSKRLNRIYP